MEERERQGGPVEQFLSSARIAADDAFHVFRFAAFPDDRPSPIYGLFTCLLNGIILTWSFSIVLGASCATDRRSWLVLGMQHAFINITFAILLMVMTRRKIQHGIEIHSSNFRIFAMDPLVIAYSAYLLWELVWLAIAAQKATSLVPDSDGCRGHLNVQIGFYVVYLLAGLIVFSATFMTEWWRQPRWRVRANIHWYLRHRELNQAAIELGIVSPPSSHQQQQRQNKKQGTSATSRRGTEEAVMVANESRRERASRDGQSLSEKCSPEVRRDTPYYYERRSASSDPPLFYHGEGNTVGETEGVEDQRRPSGTLAFARDVGRSSATTAGAEATEGRRASGEDSALPQQRSTR